MIEIDHISIRVGSGHNMVSVEEWLGIGVSERVAYIRESRVQFLSGSEVVPVKEALSAIKTRKER